VVYGEIEGGGVSCWVSKQAQYSKEDTRWARTRWQRPQIHKKERGTIWRTRCGRGQRDWSQTRWMQNRPFVERLKWTQWLGQDW